MFWPFGSREKSPRVSFVVAGAQKAGTTALDKILRQHPALCFPRAKEMHFFDSHDFDDQAPKYRRYEGYFRPRSGQICGEMTPAYMYKDGVMNRIHRYNPEMKIITILRNPIIRAHSQWSMEYGRGHETLDFADAIRTEEARLAQEPSGQSPILSYVDRGYYAAQIQRIWDVFGQDQSLVLKYEDYNQHPKATMKQIFGFLGVDEDVAVEQVRAFATAKDPLDPKDADFLRQTYAREFEALEALLGWDLDDWRAV